MSKLSSLLKATMSEGFQIFNYRGQTEQSRRITPILLGLIMGIVVLLAAMTMITDLKASGNETAILSVYALATVVIIVTEGVYKSSDLLFRPRDNDLLLAMPIKKSTIVLARIFKFYTFEMIYCLIFFLPALVAYALNTPVSASYYLVAITALLLIPVIPIVASCVIGLITSMVAVRFKHQTAAKIISTLIALLIIAILLLQLNTAPNSGDQTIAILSQKATEFYYPAAALVQLATRFSIEQYFIFIAINLAVVLVAVFIISRFYFQLVTHLNLAKHTAGITTKYQFTRHGQIFAIVKKELVKYFSTSVLIMNTALGLILFIVAIAAVCLKFDDIATSLMSSVENFPFTIDEVRAYLPSITFVLITFASLMTYITATTLSLEGKAFNSLKALPVSGRRVITAKILAAFLLIVPVTVIGAIAMIIRFEFGVLDSLLILVTAIVAPLLSEFMGALVNLKYARFNAENDAVVVRQSASVLVATFLGLGLVLTIIPLAMTAVFFAEQTTGLLIADATLTIISTFLYFAIITRGEERYSQLTA